MRRPQLLAVAAVALCLASGVQAQCRMALALALDVSGSVDTREYRMQLDGVAGALMDPSVRAALFAIPDAPVALYVYEWSAPQYQRQLIPWTLLSTPDIVGSVAARLRATPRQDSPKETGLGAALIYGGSAHDAAPPCDARTLDVSGDGENNAGPRPQDDAARRAIDGITVNGLVVVSPDTTGLPEYFRAYVRNGPFSFVEQAWGFEEYQSAMIRKLVRELQSMVIGAADVPDSAKSR